MHFDDQIIRSSLIDSSQLIPLFARLALGATRFVDNAFENPDYGFCRQRTGQFRRGLPHASQHLRFALRLIDRQSGLVLEPTHFHSARDADVQQSDQLLVDHVDAGP
jgi:hypothetical protein